MSINRRLPSTNGSASKARIESIVSELEIVIPLYEMTQTPGWEILNQELTRRELAAMERLASGSTELEEVMFNRATAQICRYFRDLPSRTQQQRDTLQAELDLVAPRRTE